MKTDLSYVHISSFLQVGPWCVNNTDIVHFTAWEKIKDATKQKLRHGRLHLLTTCRIKPWNVHQRAFWHLSLFSVKTFTEGSLPWMLLFFTSCAQSINTSGGISLIVWPWKQENQIMSIQKSLNFKALIDCSLPLAVSGKHELRTVCPHETWKRKEVE